MKLFTRSFAALLLLSPVAPAAAQENSPSIIDPETIPGLPQGPEDPTPQSPDRPLPNTPPMVVPPPDEGRGRAPDAFGGLPSPEADTADAPSDEAKGEGDAETLDTLFSELRREPSEPKAARIASRIQRQWNQSGSATIDLLMERAARSMQRKDDTAALDLLDQAIVLEPAYAEAWNRRATLNFTMNRWGRSLADIEQTLKRQPRHWGAMMGLGAILEETDHKDEALETYMQVLAIYPALKSAQDAVSRLSDELTGPAI